MIRHENRRVFQIVSVDRFSVIVTFRNEYIQLLDWIYRLRAVVDPPEGAIADRIVARCKGFDSKIFIIEFKIENCNFKLDTELKKSTAQNLW